MFTEYSLVCFPADLVLHVCALSYGRVTVMTRMAIMTTVTITMTTKTIVARVLTDSYHIKCLIFTGHPLHVDVF